MTRMETKVTLDAPLVCDLSVLNESDRARMAKVSMEIVKMMESVHPLAQGYSFHASNNSDTLRKIAEWIPLEQACCPFLHFEITVGGGQTDVIVNLTGPPGTREFLEQELSGAAAMKADNVQENILQ